jgi:hypothetical protein
VAPAKVKRHAGNQLFRERIDASVQSYSDATSKVGKSMVVSAVVDFFRERSMGGFVKEKEGLWYEVGENLAREKVGQAFRERLNHKYRSSTKAKRRRWKQEGRRWKQEGRPGQEQIAEKNNNKKRKASPVREEDGTVDSMPGKHNNSMKNKNMMTQILDEALPDRSGSMSPEQEMDYTSSLFLSNKEVTHRINTLHKPFKSAEQEASIPAMGDSELLNTFTQGNIELLEFLKVDDDIQRTLTLDSNNKRY